MAVGAPDIVERTVQVRNLNSRTDAKSLASAFARFGPIENVQIITQFIGRETVSMGFAFVEFKTAEGYHAALAGSDDLVADGRRLIVRQSTPPRLRKRDTAFVLGIPPGTTADDLMAAFAASTAAKGGLAPASEISGELPGLPEHAVYIGNLNRRTRAKYLGQAFARFGAVEDVRINAELEGSEMASLGDGFVKFKAAEGFRAALAGGPGIAVDGNPLIVRPSVPPRPAASVDSRPTAVRIIREDGDGWRRSAFVTFATEDDQARAVSDHRERGLPLNGGISQVRFARPPHGPCRRSSSQATPLAPAGNCHSGSLARIKPPGILNGLNASER
jgi:RNA recognition motif-containing protein